MLEPSTRDNRSRNLLGEDLTMRWVLAVVLVHMQVVQRRRQREVNARLAGHSA